MIKCVTKLGRLADNKIQKPAILFKRARSITVIKLNTAACKTCNQNIDPDVATQSKTKNEKTPRSNKPVKNDQAKTKTAAGGWKKQTR